MTRVLFMGDMAPTGFGTVTQDLGRRLITRDLDVRFISMNEMTGELPEPFNSRTLSITSLVSVVNAAGESGVESGRDMSSLFTDVAQSKLMNGEPWGEWSPEATFLLGDIQNVRFQVAANPELLKYHPLHYCPVEGVDLPPSLKEGLWNQCQPVAMSNFGADEIEKVMGVRPPMVYHGIDTTVFHPAKPSNPITFGPPAEGAPPLQLKSKDNCKAFWAAWFGMKVPPKWMLRTDRHMPRKRYNAMLRSLIPVLAEHPDTLMVIHCNHTDQGGSLPDTISKFPGVREIRTERVTGNISPPQGYALFGREYPQIILTNLSGLQRDQLVSLYNAADLYLSTSAEGFGLTIAEALACGVPAVGLDYSAVPEVIGPAGVLVPAAYLYDNEYDHFWAAVDEQQFALAVHNLLNDQEKREALGRKGPRHIRANFSWDVAADQFADLLRNSALEEAA